MKEKYDVVVIGAGILGCLTARELMRYDLSVLVLDKASDLGEGATKANTAVLYPGFHPRGGSLKGISCAAGNRMHKKLSEELDVPMKYTGSLFVAFHDEGVESLKERIKKGKKNGVPDMKMITGDEARNIEPMISEKVIAAMYASTTGITSPFHLVLNAASNAAENGTEFIFDCRVEQIEPDSNGFLLNTEKGTIKCSYLVNTAGDEAAEMECFVRSRDLIIKPRRGEYLVFDSPSPINHVIYQVQEDEEKGTLLAPTVDGNMVAGPTSVNIPNYDRTETTIKGRDHIKKVAKKILPDLDMSRIISSYAGVRANIDNLSKEEKDFIIRKSAPGFVSALGIKNPGMTAAPYLVDLIISQLKEDGMPDNANKNFNPIYKSPPIFLKAEPETQSRLLRENKAYGNVICRCENITEGDLLNTLHSTLPPHNINGLKKRLRTGMGRCQGGFCTPRILDILSREWNVSPENILKEKQGSMFVKGRLR